MISQKELRFYSSLLTKKHRRTEKKFLVEGKKSVLEGLNSSYECEIIFTTHNFVEENEKLISDFDSIGRKVVTLKQKEFQKLSDTESPQGIAAVFVKPDFSFSTKKFEDDRIIVMLDNISDPGNLGTIIRNCDWFAVKNILISDKTVDYTSPKVIRSSMGSVFHVNIFENITAANLDEFRSIGYEILCADIEGENIFSYQSKKKKILVLSSESHGPGEEFGKISDKKITVPKLGSAESLNVASASAVLLAILTK